MIFLSALDQPDDKLAAFNAGAFDYVTKPFAPEEVRARIEAQLRLREIRETVERHNGELEKLVNEQIREIASAQMSAIFALAKLADSRDRRTGKHLERLQAFSGILAAK